MEVVIRRATTQEPGDYKLIYFPADGNVDGTNSLRVQRESSLSSIIDLQNSISEEFQY